MHPFLSWIDDNTPDLIALSDEIWRYAEVGLQETRSAAAQADYLQKQGFRVTLGVAGMATALVAEYGDGKPKIGFLGEYDALAGLSQKPVMTKDPLQEGAPGHGCGHNLLGVGSLASAVALKREIEAGRVKGTVRYYGCPAEETASGKVWMAKYGLFDDLDAAITWHPMEMNIANWGSNLAVNSVRFAFHGRTAHAAAAPHMGISALDAVELMNVGVNYLREHVIQEARIHYVITKGGGQPNVVPAEAEVWYYIRAPRRQEMLEIYDRVIKIAEGAAMMTGARLEVKFIEGAHNYLPNDVVTQLLEDCLETIGGPKFSADDMAFAHEIEKSFDPGQKAAVLKASHVPPEYWDLTLHEGVARKLNKGIVSPGSTDVSDVSWITPTGEITTATWVMGVAGHSWQITATGAMGIGHKGMIVAAKAMALAGYELMTKPELLAKAHEAFVKDTGGKPYVSPLPAEMMSPAEQF